MKILEWSSKLHDLNPRENLWWDFKKAVASRKPKNNSELEAIAHEDSLGTSVWLHITFAAGHKSKRVLLILKMSVMKGLNNLETAVVINSAICVLTLGKPLLIFVVLNYENCSCFLFLIFFFFKAKKVSKF